MTDTPRVDAVYAESRFSTADDLRIELADLARQLERDLAAANAEREELRKAVKELLGPSSYGRLSTDDRKRLNQLVRKPYKFTPTVKESLTLDAAIAAREP